MKLTIFKKTLSESAVKVDLGSTEIETSELHDKKVINSIANKVHELGFPSQFAIATKASTGDKITYTFKMVGKKINEEIEYHQIDFEYELDQKSTIIIKKILSFHENNDADPDGDSYEELYDELTIDQFFIIAEFESDFTKVRGSLK